MLTPAPSLERLLSTSLDSGSSLPPLQLYSVGYLPALELSPGRLINPQVTLGSVPWPSPHNGEQSRGSNRGFTKPGP